MKTFKLEVDEQELNHILSVLGTRPFMEVFTLIEKLRLQVAEQQKPAE